MKILHSDWDDTRVEQLTEMHHAGMPYRDIATAIGLSRNAVIGKAHRLNLPPRTSDGLPPPRPVGVRLPPRKRKPRPTRKVPAMFDDADIVAAPLPEGDFRCTIFELTNEKCRYPMWTIDASEKFYCGNPSADFVGGRVYCRYHTALCAGGGLRKI